MSQHLNDRWGESGVATFTRTRPNSLSVHGKGGWGVRDGGGALRSRLGETAVSTRESRSAAYILPVSDGVHRRMRIGETAT